MAENLEAAWDRVWEALPAHWTVGAPSHDPGRETWSVSAIDTRTTGRGKLPRAVTGTGATEAEALLDPDAESRGLKEPDGTRLEELRRQLRLVYVDAAEEWTREHVGRAMSADELAGVVGRVPKRAQPGSGDHETP